MPGGIRILAGLMPAAAALAACRTPPDDLAGSWSGVLDCAEGELAYRTVAELTLDAPVDGRHIGTLALAASWSGADGVSAGLLSDWEVTVVQSFPRGAQDARFTDATCAAASRWEDGFVVEEGCAAVGTGIGTGSLRWDGADALEWSGACEGTLVRGGAGSGSGPADSGDPVTSLR